MLPSELRLLRGVRDALNRAVATDPDSKAVAAIEAANVGLDELILRTDREFFATHYAQAFALANEGIRLVEERALARDEHSPQLSLRGLPETAATLDTSQISARLDSLRGALQRIVACLAPHERGDREIKHYLARVVDWENRLHAVRLQRSAAVTPAEEVREEGFTQKKLEQYLHTRFPEWGDVQVAGLKALAGGFSKKTVLVELERAGGRKQSLVIRAEQPMTLVFFDGAQIDNEYLMLQFAHAAGICVAKPLWLESDASLFGVRFMVSEKAPGRNIGTAVSVREEVSAPLLENFIQHLVRIHRTPIDLSDVNVQKSHLGRWAQYQTLTDSTQANVAYWTEEIGRMNLPPSPIVTRALEWLTNNIPECDETPSLIHRDYGLHNILVQDDRVSCILDWENATIGDPAEDLAWLTDGVRGRIDRQQILDLYAKASGNEIPERRLRFFDVFTSLKFSSICAQAIALFEKHPEVPVSACQLGLLYMHHGTGPLNHYIEMAETEVGR